MKTFLVIALALTVTPFGLRPVGAQCIGGQCYRPPINAAPSYAAPVINAAPITFNIGQPVQYQLRAVIQNQRCGLFGWRSCAVLRYQYVPVQRNNGQPRQQ